MTSNNLSHLIQIQWLCLSTGFAYILHVINFSISLGVFSKDDSVGLIQSVKRRGSTIFEEGFRMGNLMLFVVTSQIFMNLQWLFNSLLFSNIFLHVLYIQIPYIVCNLIKTRSLYLLKLSFLLQPFYCYFHQGLFENADDFWLAFDTNSCID